MSDPMRHPHTICEDSWYSCPKTGECSREGIDHSECWCGADEINAYIEQLEHQIGETSVDTETPVDTDPDTRMNEILAAGGVWGVLIKDGGVSVTGIAENGHATNSLYFWFDFLKSRYRLTVTEDPE